MKRLTQADQIRQRGEESISHYLRMARAWHGHVLRELRRNPTPMHKYHSREYARYEAMRYDAINSAREIRFVLTGKKSLTEQRREDRRMAKYRTPQPVEGSPRE